MTKEQLKAYINEAIEALDQEDLAEMFPASQQPSMYALAHELIGLRGEVRKLSSASLKLGTGVQTLSDRVVVELSQSLDDKETVRVLLDRIIEQDELIIRTAESYAELPELGYFNLNDFKAKLSAWKKGYNITQERWTKFIKSLGLVKTGLAGEAFDPLYHEAVAIKDMAGIADGIIVETEITGFIYKKQLVRRAKVVVNKRQNT